MGGKLKIHLKANERIFINGGVLKVDRKVSFELVSNVVFLLESHVMPIEEATTPLKQLYYIVQSMLMEPGTVDLARQIYAQSHGTLIATFKDQGILEGLVEVRQLVEGGKPFEALKKLRTLFPAETEVLAAAGLALPAEQPAASSPAVDDTAPAAVPDRVRLEPAAE